MTQNECLICFCPSEDAEFSCGDPLCKAITCGECTPSLIEYSKNEGLIPKCCSDKCNSYYLLSSLTNPHKIDTNYTKLETVVFENYYKAVLDYMMRDKGEQVQKKMEQDVILKRLRKERIKFIKETFQPAIAKVANLTFASKIRRLEKQRTKMIAEKMNSSHRTCMNLYCNGHLDEKLSCMSCMSKFCEKCEKLISQDGKHSCRREDVESISFINNMIRCPECKLPVHKDVGCDSITCSNCGTKFKYSTGERGGHGSNNAVIQLEEKRKLSNIYRDKFTVSEKAGAGRFGLSRTNRDKIRKMDLLLEIELKEPKAVTEKAMLNTIKMMYQTGNQDSAGKQMARRLDVYMINKYRVRCYQHTLGELENQLQKNELTVRKMEKLLERLEKFGYN